MVSAGGVRCPGTKVPLQSGCVSAIRIEDPRPVDELDSTGRRQIASRERTTALLEDRREEIQTAISQAVVIVQAPLAQQPEANGWKVSSVTATFGITLSAEAGVILTRASAEASFEVTLTIERT